MTQKASEPIGRIGEIELIRRLCRALPTRSDVAAGPGDDCAVVRARGGRYDWLLKADPVIEGIHFRPDAAGRRIGRKAIGRVLSDIAAMGGEPLWVLVDLAAPPDTPVERMNGLMAGLAARARRAGAAVVGGDVSAGPALEAHVFAVGRVEKGKAVLRSGARPGDALFVTGSLGGSGAGKHLDFVPRLAEGRWLARAGWARAMMDLSDGLAADLPRLCQASRVGACLDLNAIPVAPALKRLRARSEWMRRALTDGEDYELLLAVSPARAPALARAWRRTWRIRLTRIGVCTDAAGIVEGRDADGRSRPLGVSGFEHFVRSRPLRAKRTGGAG